MEGYALFKRKGTGWFKPWSPDEDMTGVSVSEADTPGPGGWIGVNKDDPTDRWYVNPDYFRKNYERI